MVCPPSHPTTAKGTSNQVGQHRTKKQRPGHIQQKDSRRKARHQKARVGYCRTQSFLPGVLSYPLFRFLHPDQNGMPRFSIGHAIYSTSVFRRINDKKLEESTSAPWQLLNGVSQPSMPPKVSPISNPVPSRRSSKSLLQVWALAESRVILLIFIIAVYAGYTTNYAQSVTISGR